ncbi:transposase [Novosphingobium sp.]|uniref:transposase n=1 Tax=Novosphingobium sp. TaxID=1874826 RepID=UPI0031D41754
MSDLYWLTDEQIERLSPYLPKSHGKPRVDDQRVLSEIIFVNRNGLRWRDAPRNTDRKSHALPVKYDKRRNHIEIMFGCLRDWHRVATRYDHCPTGFFSLPLAATMLFWL